MILWVALIAGAWASARHSPAPAPDFGPGGMAALCSAGSDQAEPSGDTSAPAPAAQGCMACLLSLAMATPPALPTLAVDFARAAALRATAAPSANHGPPAYLRRPSHAPPLA